MSKCIVLFSGGTDSMACVVSLTKKFSEIHLLTFRDQSNKKSVYPQERIDLLKTKFPNIVFKNEYISTDSIIKELTFKNYLKKVIRYKFFMTLTCGFSSLSWHLAAIKYALKHKIFFVSDGMTKEMMHLPGHMPQFLLYMKKQYNKFDIIYENSVIDWDIPDPKHIEDKFIINQHGYLFPSEEKERTLKKTTGKYLFDHGILSNSDIKGSFLDQTTQHDCYPFVLYNIVYYWFFKKMFSDDYIEQKVSSFFNNLADVYISKNFLKG